MRAHACVCMCVCMWIHYSRLYIPPCAGSSCPDVVRADNSSGTKASLPGNIQTVLISQTGGHRCHDFLLCSHMVHHHMVLFPDCSPPHGTIVRFLYIFLLNGVRVKTRSDSQGNLVSASIVCVPKVCGKNSVPRVCGKNCLSLVCGKTVCP